MNFDEKAVLKLYKTGLSDYKIGKELDIARWKVRDIRNKYDLPANHKWGGASKIVFDEEQKILISKLHSQDLSLIKIAKELKVCSKTIRNFCEEEGLEVGRDRGIRIRNTIYPHIHERIINIFNYLEVNGPIQESILKEKFGGNQHFFNKFYNIYFDEIETFSFKGGKRASRYRYDELYNDSLQFKKIISIKNDSRIIEFIAKNIIFEIKNRHDATTLMLNISRFIDKERAKKIIEYKRLHNRGNIKR